KHATFAQEHERFRRIAYGHSHDRMIGGIGNGKRMDINFRPGQFFTHTRERARPVAEEHCQLRSGFDLDRWLVSHICTRCRSSSVLTIKTVSPAQGALYGSLFCLPRQAGTLALQEGV